MSLQEWLQRLKENEDNIFVREQIDGRWQSVSLASLSPERWAFWVSEWLSTGHLPAMVKSG